MGVTWAKIDADVGDEIEFSSQPGVVYLVTSIREDDGCRALEQRYPLPKLAPTRPLNRHERRAQAAKSRRAVSGK